MRNCEALKHLLDLHLDGELSEEAAIVVERHLLGCAACAHEVQTLEQCRAMLQQAVEPETAAPAFRERTAARLRNAFAHRFAQLPETARLQWSLPLTGDE
ncbi:MAG TPA: zf-HC2 domain-containing protein [Chthonomonadales bacterium]|nr:zf-HC2 domain-containing protein [Chthonomonadales bacterium]